MFDFLLMLFWNFIIVFFSQFRNLSLSLLSDLKKTTQKTERFVSIFIPSKITLAPSYSHPPPASCSATSDVICVTAASCGSCRWSQHVTSTSGLCNVMMKLTLQSTCYNLTPGVLNTPTCFILHPNSADRLQPSLNIPNLLLILFYYSSSPQYFQVLSILMLAETNSYLY